MASPYTTSSPPGGPWQGDAMRSVTPATNNTRYTGRYPSAPRTGQAGTPSIAAAAAAAAAVNDPYRSMTPNRFGVYNRPEVAPAAAAAANTTEPRTPSSTGLIRLSLKKPMGIVFEPMYDPNQPAVQRGVRICDLPRTGAAALSRKLQVGDELLQINDTTVSRMTFDEIMDFIIEADPESVNLLFRRPRKETLQARQGVQQKLNAAANKDNPSTVKWVDEKDGERPGKDRKSSSNKKKPNRKSRRPKKGSSVSEEEETLQSSTVGDESYDKSSRGSRRKSRSRRGGPYESESFLDLLIDTICSNSNNMCRDAFRNKDDDYSDDEDTLVSELDEDTYATYDESLEPRGGKARKKHSSSFEDEPEDKRRHSSSRKEKEKKEKAESKKYIDDGTLESEESADRVKDTHRQPAVPVTPSQPPLGLTPNPPPQPVLPTVPAETEDENNPAPIKELEYDDRFDHGADVSVMESLGGPSLLIEKQRAAQAASRRLSQTVPEEIINSFGMDYPAAFGLTREQTIQSDPLKYYTYVVKKLLEQHEPEKVRLLDKLLAKYKGREDHLVQKLSVRYNRTEEGAQAVDQNDNFAFTDAVKKSKASSTAAAAVNLAKDRLQQAAQNGSADHEWPEKEEKEPDVENGLEESESGSEYSRDSVDGTSPAVIAQVSELLNYVYGKTSVPGQIDRVSTIMRAYEGREAVLLELLETKALIKANKEKENADNLPSFLRNSHMTQAQKNADELEATELPPVTPMATQDQQQNGTVINDDISSMSGVSSPAPERDIAGGITATVSIFLPRNMVR